MSAPGCGPRAGSAADLASTVSELPLLLFAQEWSQSSNCLPSVLGTPSGRIGHPMSPSIWRNSSKPGEGPSDILL